MARKFPEFGRRKIVNKDFCATAYTSTALVLMFCKAEGITTEEEDREENLLDRSLV